MELEDQSKTLVSISAGEIPSFFVDRAPKTKKMSCSRFGKNETKVVLDLIKKDVMFGRDWKIIAPPEATPTSFRGCEGIRIKGEAEKQDGTRWIVDAHAVSDGKILFLFALRNIKKNYKKNLSVYEKAMSTVQLTSIDGFRVLREQNLLTEVSGTATDPELQRDITQELIEEASKYHKGCEHRVLKAEAYQEQAKRLGAEDKMLIEKWFVKSCETVNIYEVLLLFRPDIGGTDIGVRKIGTEE